MISRKLRKTMTTFLGKMPAATGAERINQWAIMSPLISQSPVNIKDTENPLIKKAPVLVKNLHFRLSARVEVSERNMFSGLP